MKKNWRERELTMEVIVGAFMVMIVLGLGYFTIILSNETWFRQKTEMEVMFPHVMGLSSGDPVTVRGMPVGKVRSLDLHGDGSGSVHVVLALDDPVTLHEDYKIIILTTSILGGRQLELIEGSRDKPVVEKTVYRGSAPYDLMGDAAHIVNTVRGTLIDGGVLENIETAVAQIGEMVDRVHRGEGTVGKLLSDDDTLYRDAAAAMTAVRAITERIETGAGSLGRLLSDDDSLYQDLAASAAGLNRIIAAVDDGEGFIGQLIRDEALYDEIKAIVSEVRAAVDDLRETAPLTTFGSILFGAF